MFFSYFSVSQKRNIKQSPNGMKPSGCDFFNKLDPGDLKCPSRNKGGRHEAGGAPNPLGAPSTLMGPPLLHRCTSSSYIYPRTPQTSRSTTKANSSYIYPRTREIPSWGHFRSSAGGGIDHGGPLHQLHASPVMGE